MAKITLKQLEIFAAVAESGSFTRSAEQLYMTQSTVSIHIAALEAALGVSLLQRDNHKKVTLTASGRTVYAYAREILHRCRELEQSVTQKEPEKLRIAASSVPAQCLLPDIMAEFVRFCASCSFVLRKGDTTDVHNLLRSGSVHIGFVGAALDRKGMDYTPLMEDTLVLVAPNNAYFREKHNAGVSGDSLLGEPLIVRESESGSRKEFEQYLLSIGITMQALNIVAEIDRPETILESVSSGVGVSVVSAMTAAQAIADGRLLSFPLGRGLKRSLYLATRKDFRPTETEAEFIKYVKNRIAQ